MDEPKWVCDLSTSFEQSLDQFVVVCDQRNNTPEDVEQNRLNVTIMFKPEVWPPIGWIAQAED